MAPRKVICGTVIWFLLLPAVIEAQLNRGTIEGLVTDPQSAVVPDAAVKITAVDTNVVLATRTDKAGYYRVVDLVPGRYRVQVTAPGFFPLEVAGVELTAGVVTRVDAQLKLGHTQQVVQVSAGAPLLQTGASNFSTTIQSQTIEDVPLQGRDLMQLVFMIPGINSVSGPPGSNFGFNSQFGSFPDPNNVVDSQLTVNGGEPGFNAFYLDGNFNLSSFAENAALNPPPDAVAEFQAITNAFAAEYSRTAGGVFNVVLKSGTNQLHGDLYEYIQNSALNARNPFTSIGSQGQIIPQNVLHYNDFGGTLGGPVILPKIYNGKDKTFFFFSWDARILHLLGNQTFTVPTPLMRQGNFSEDPNSAQYGIWDPVTSIGPASDGTFARSAFGTPLVPNGCTGQIVAASGGGTTASNPTSSTCSFSPSVPANRFDPIAVAFMKSFPNPNYLSPLSSCPLASGGQYRICDNYIGPVGTSQVMQNISAKIDQNWSSKSRYFFEWLYNPTRYREFAVPWTGMTYPGGGFGSSVPLDVHNQIFGIGNTYTFTPTLINEFHYNFSRQFNNTRDATISAWTQYGALKQAESLLSPAKIPSNGFYPTPTVGITGPQGSATNFGIPTYQNANVMSEAHTILDNLTKVVARHTIKTGFIYRLDHAAWESNQPTGLFFNGAITSNPVTTLGGEGFAQFLLGTVGTGDPDYVGIFYGNYERWSSWGFYVQDDFRMTPDFTLNIGLREDLYGSVATRYHPQSNFCLSCLNPLTGLPGEVVYDGTKTWPAGGPLFPYDKNNFGPRINFSWTPFGSRGTVIRGGYDIFTSTGTDLQAAPGQFSEPGWQNTVNWPISLSPSQCASFSGKCLAWTLSDTSTNKGLLTFPPLTSAILPASQRSPQLGTTMSGEGQRPTRDPMIQSWNLEVQHELPGNMMLSVGYVGNHGTHLFGEPFRDYGYVPTADLIQYRAAINTSIPITQVFSSPLTASALQNIYGSPDLPRSILLRHYPAFTGVFVRPFDGTSIYHGMNVNLKKRFSHGLDFNIAYTVSKNITNALIANAGSYLVDSIHLSGPGGRSNYTLSPFSNPLTGGVFYQDPDHRKDRMIAPTDIPQMLNIFGSYELPFGAGKALLNQTGIVNGVFGGWKLSSNFNAESGIPLAITCPGDQLTNRCNLVGNPKAVAGGQTAAHWINPAAFQPPFGGDQTFWANYSPNDPRAYLFGTSGPTLPSIRTPGFWGLSSALFKDFPIRETKKLEFRWEVFNALNHQNLGIPNTAFCLPPGPGGETDLVHQAGCQFGRITNVQTDPRTMEFSLKLFW
jgi:hypothetical protein